LVLLWRLPELSIAHFLDCIGNLMLAVREKRLMKDWSGKRVIVIGAARQGIALSRYLIQHGAQVVLNDRLPLDQLSSARKALQGEPIEWVSGGHPVSMLDGVDLVCVSGGIPLDLPIIREAQRRGITISNDSQIFLEVCPCRVIGITGSAGKTTTTTLVGLIAQAAVDELGARSVSSNTDEVRDTNGSNGLMPGSQVWVGGNIGIPLLSVVDDMEPHDLAVMELSSFQLEVMVRSPEIAAILNITPNHLDRHLTMQAYQAAKARILEFQPSQSSAILNMDDPIAWSMTDKVNGRLVPFGSQRSPEYQEGVYLSPDGNSILVNSPMLATDEELVIMNRDQIPLRGDHNLLNVLGACAIALAAGLTRSAMVSGVKKFSGIPHRLEFVRTWGGGEWYNDSIATAPERTVAAVKSFSEPLILLAGGRDKNLPWDTFASIVSQRVNHLILFGEAAEIISQALAKYRGATDTSITFCSGLKEAVQAAALKVIPGDVVLLSPGGTSFDEFHDFEDRGEAYKRWVMELL
jgi:UDP-N-acetylmuramoylalanine--D-glutamate ligase